MLAGVLSAAMVLGTMAIPAFADESTSGKAAKIGETEYATLTEAVDAANANDTIKILSDITESVEIENGKTITLDLNGKTLTNTGDANTITNNGTLEIVDSSADKTGKVKNANTSKAILFNAGGATATLNGGTFERTESETYYATKNLGTMTINEGVTVNQFNESSSAVANGCANSGEYTDSDVNLTINGGIFVQGLITIKNDECGVLEINGGSFENIKGKYTVFNWNKAVINDGTFKATYVVCNGKYNDYAVGDIDIKGGTFNGSMTVAQVHKGSLNVKGGYYDLAPSVKSQIPAYAKYIINAIDSAFKDGSVIISVTGGTFVNFDPSANPEGIDTSYVAKGYYSKDNQNGTFSVLQSAAKVIYNAKSAGVKVTLGNLEKNSAIDETADATYNVVLDTVKSDDKAKVDEIKNANPNKTVIAYDIYVEKTENGIKSEVKDVTNQKVTLKLPTKVKEDGGITVYHNTDVVQNVTLSADRKSISFIAPSFSAYTFVYDAANLTADDITKNVKVEFEKVTDSEYDIILKATEANKKINGLLTADLTFSLTQGTTGLVNYEITPAANMSLLVN